MPTLQSMRLPTPTNWQDFETIVRDAQALRWNSGNLQKNGRPGQAQQGVDIYGPDEIGRPVGIQCKCYKGALGLSDVEAEITNAEKFQGKLITLFIATTAEHDSVLQQEVRTLSDIRVAQGKFSVSMLYWEEIISSLLLNSEAFRAHFPQLSLPEPQQPGAQQLLAALEIGYRGGELESCVDLFYGNMASLDFQDSYEFIVITDSLKQRCQQSLSQNDSATIIQELEKVKNLLVKGYSEPDLSTAKKHAKRVSMHLHKMGTLGSIEEDRILNMGLQLAQIYFHYSELPGKNLKDQLKSQAMALLGENSASEIEAEFTLADSLNNPVMWAIKIYTLISSRIRYKL